MKDNNALDEMMKDNNALVKDAALVRDHLKKTIESITMVVDLAEPIAGQHEPEPSEYIIHADNLDALRQVLVDYKLMNTPG